MKNGRALRETSYAHLEASNDIPVCFHPTGFVQMQPHVLYCSKSPSYSGSLLETKFVLGVGTTRGLQMRIMLEFAAL